MINPLHIDDSPASQVFFFSDVHAGHEKPFILEPRGFTSAAESIETIVERWNSKITNNDVVFLLGDSVVGAGANGRKVLEDFLEKVNFRVIYLMPGNHFSGFKDIWKEFRGKKVEIDSDYKLTYLLDNKIIHLIPNYYEIFVNRQPIVLCHYPIVSWNYASQGGWCIHGHTHGNLIKSDIGKLLYQGKILDVGVESIEMPISFTEIREIMNSTPQVTFDHH